jgi:two-component system, OmpR family, phosphate regulon sensor histidine kinase PhoR
VSERTAELEAANDRLDTVVRQMPAAVIVVDAAGRITLVNRFAEELMREAGHDPRDAGSYLEVAFTRLDGTPYPEAQRPIRRALEGGEATIAERVDLLLQGGGRRQLELSAAPLRERTGAIVGAVAVTADVTEREQRARAEREFVANAAHQLRTPLAAIRSSIEVLQAGAKDDTDARERFLGHIERESERLTRLARTLLMLARAESSLEQPAREIVDADTLLAGVARRVHVPRGVTVEVRCTPGLAALANRELLEEALTCLADNAVRHAGASIVRLDGRAENGSLLLEVVDEGRGIPLEFQDKMFDRFFRGGNGSGFGLGLSIASQAVRVSGGSLEIDSEPGRGTAARITLPAARMLTP